MSCEAALNIIIRPDLARLHTEIPTALDHHIQHDDDESEYISPDHVLNIVNMH